MKNFFKKISINLLGLASLALIIGVEGQSMIVLADDQAPVGFRGEYFNNVSLSGTPVFVRIDPVIYFDWGGNPPGAGMPAQNYSIRWTKNDTFGNGIYKFTTLTDDGVRLYIDDKLIIDKWVLQNSVTNTVEWPVTAGVHTIKMEYFQEPEVAKAQLSYQLITTSTSTPVSNPSPQPTVTPTNPTPPVLPKTGLPALAWATAALIPVGLKMRGFSKIKGQLKDSPNYLWEERQFKTQP